MANPIVLAANAIIEAKRSKGHVLIFTGAGVSIASGVPSFTSAEVFRCALKKPRENCINTVLEKPLYLLREVTMFARRILSAKPNIGHYAMAWLVKNKYAQTIMTGNGDGLHEKTLGLKKGARYGGWHEKEFLELFNNVNQKKTIPIAMELIIKSKILIVSGWSQDEHGLIKLARERGVKIIEVGPTRSYAGRKDIFIEGFSQIIFPELQREIYMLDR